VTRALRLATALSVLTLSALAPAVAQGRALRAPRWLLPPYRSYVLTYDATESSRGSEVESYPNRGCDGLMTTSQDAQTVHFHAAYQFLFGRSRDSVTRRLQFAFVYVLRKLSGPGQDTYSSTTSFPPCCPPPDPRDSRIGSGSCTARFGLDRAATSEALTLGYPRRVHGASVFAIAFDPNSMSGTPACTGADIASPDAKHFPPVAPSTGSLSFSDRSVRARRTFNGRVVFTPDGAHSGSGTEQTDVGSQLTWTFDTSMRGSFRLAPGTTVR
jgi:hypothetical protein